MLFNIQFADLKIDHSYTKYKCYFNTVENKNLIDKICLVEKNILAAIDTKKKRNYNIKNQLLTGNIKFFEQKRPDVIKELILKISGIWDNPTDIGLTYKFMVLKPTS